MAKLIKVIDNQTIELISYRNPNVCFSIEDTTYIRDEGIPRELKTNKFQDCEYYCDFKEQINPFELYSKSKEQDKEIARLNKIIDDLEKWLKEKRDLMYDYENPKKSVKPYGIEKDLYHTRYCVYYDILNKLKELKEEGNKDE